MADPTDELATYLQHLQARIRAQGRGESESVPADLTRLCSSEPDACFEMILRALDEAVAPEIVVAIGNGLLEDLLNEHADVLDDSVSRHLRGNEKFRQAFSFGNHASVDPTILEGWLTILRDLGASKSQERKKTFRRR